MRTAAVKRAAAQAAPDAAPAVGPTPASRPPAAWDPAPWTPVVSSRPAAPPVGPVSPQSSLARVPVDPIVQPKLAGAAPPAGAPAGGGTGRGSLAEVRVEPPVQPACRTCSEEAEALAPPVLRHAVLGGAGDPFEREADAVADRVTAEPAPRPVAPAVTPLSRAAALPQASARPDGAAAAAAPGAAAPVSGEVRLRRQAAQAVDGGGRPLTAAERGYFEPRFGRSFGDVRLHAGGRAGDAARAIGAHGYAVGRNVAFAQGQYAPDTPRGRWLLAHELAHVVQQRSGKADGAATAIQPVTHGPSTPTNCHNWRIPLPPWIAGSLAHLQAAYHFARNPGSAGTIRPEVTMPRGTKVLMGVPTPPSITPPGFVDLMGIKTGGVEIGEIKSTASAALAQPQAAHYLMRHTEWLARAPWTDRLDVAYGAAIGGAKPGALMSGLASVTGTGTAVGAFMGDPLKTLHLEADTMGAIVYWCTGVGTTNPAWARVFQRIMRSVIDAFWEAYRAIRGLIDDLIDWVGDNPVLAFVILVCLVIIGLIIAILAGLLEVPSVGTSTPALLGGLALSLSAAVALLALIGVDTGDLAPASEGMVAVLTEMSEAADASPAAYERDADQGGWSTATVGAAPGADMDPRIGAFAAAAAGLPARLADHAVAAVNPLSSTPLPSPTADRLAAARRAAGAIGQSPRTEIAEIGRHALTLADRIDGTTA